MPAAVGPASEAGREQPREGLHPSEVAADVENQRRVTPALQMLRPLGVRKNRRDVAEHPAHPPGTSMASGQALYCVLAVSRALGWTLPQRPCSQPSGSLRQVARCHLRRKQWAGRLTSLVCALGETGRLSEPAFAHMNKGLFKTCENSVKNLRNRRDWSCLDDANSGR